MTFGPTQYVRSELEDIGVPGVPHGIGCKMSFRGGYGFRSLVIVSEDA